MCLININFMTTCIDWTLTRFKLENIRDIFLKEGKVIVTIYVPVFLMKCIVYAPVSTGPRNLGVVVCLLCCKLYAVF